jgi:hypothetical protein
VETLLTHFRSGGRICAYALLSVLLTSGHSGARAEDASPEPKDSQARAKGSDSYTPALPEPPPATEIKIKSRTFEKVRPAGGNMTWLLQKTVYTDGTRVVTPAGVQFEDSFGLSVLMLDDVSPRESEPFPSSPPQAGRESQPALLEDQSDAAPLTETAPELKIQLRSLLVDLNELKTNETARAQVPRCEDGRRRAVAFLRPEKLAGELTLGKKEAEQWSRYGRAACVQWSTLPKTVAVKN